jgi:hypothetical protein
MTVKELIHLLEKEVKEGNGDLPVVFEVTEAYKHSNIKWVEVDFIGPEKLDDVAFGFNGDKEYKKVIELS